MAPSSVSQPAVTVAPSSSSSKAPSLMLDLKCSFFSVVLGYSAILLVWTFTLIHRAKNSATEGKVSGTESWTLIVTYGVVILCWVYFICSAAFARNRRRNAQQDHDIELGGDRQLYNTTSSRIPASLRTGRRDDTDGLNAAVPEERPHRQSAQLRVAELRNQLRKSTPPSRESPEPVQPTHNNLQFGDGPSEGSIHQTTPSGPNTMPLTTITVQRSRLTNGTGISTPTMPPPAYDRDWVRL